MSFYSLGLARVLPLPRATGTEDPRLVRNSVVLWALLALAAFVATIRDPADGDNIYDIYRAAAFRWQHGENLYNDGGYGFIYLPPSAVALIPFANLPYQLGGQLWRAVNLAVFAAGVLALVRLIGQEKWRTMFLVATVPAVIISWTSTRHGQMTLCMGGLMMLGAAALARQRWWTAAGCLCLAVALKPLAVVLLLLAAAIYPKNIGRIVACALVLFAIPFLTQQPEYVLDQYAQSLKMLSAAAHDGVLQEYANLYWVLQSAGLGLTEDAQRLVSLTGALATLGLCYWAARKLPPRKSAVVLYTLAVAYLLLLSPRTERNTYSLLGPALGLFAAQAWKNDRNRIVYAIFGLAFMFELTHPLGTLVAGRATPWMKPLLCLVFVGPYLAGLVRTLNARTEQASASRDSEAKHPAPSVSRRRAA